MHTASLGSCFVAVLATHSSIYCIPGLMFCCSVGDKVYLLHQWVQVFLECCFHIQVFPPLLSSFYLMHHWPHVFECWPHIQVMVSDQLAPGHWTFITCESICYLRLCRRHCPGYGTGSLLSCIPKRKTINSS